MTHRQGQSLCVALYRPRNPTFSVALSVQVHVLDYRRRRVGCAGTGCAHRRALGGDAQRWPVGHTELRAERTVRFGIDRGRQQHRVPRAAVAIDRHRSTGYHVQGPPIQRAEHARAHGGRWGTLCDDRGCAVIDAAVGEHAQIVGERPAILTGPRAHRIVASPAIASPCTVQHRVDSMHRAAAGMTDQRQRIQPQLGRSG